MNLPKMHPREHLVRKKENELSAYLVNFQGELTTAEFLRVLSNAFRDVLNGIAKYAIRLERHGNTEKPGGLE